MNFRAGKYEEGKQVLAKLMIKTGTPLTKLDEVSDKLVIVSDSENSEEKSSITKLFTRDFRTITLMCYLCMFAACMASVRGRMKSIFSFLVFFNFIIYKKRNI